MHGTKIKILYIFLASILGAFEWPVSIARLRDK
jgi:hypothetical protein